MILLALNAAAVAADRYEKIGNGWCLSPDGARLKLGPHPHMHGSDVSWQQGSQVNVDGSSPRCERTCSRIDDCIGYMTEDQSACTIIKSSDHHAGRGIFKADSERRNYCWARVKADLLEDESSCEAAASWPDGREEARECVVLKLKS